MKIVLIGATGFVGSHILTELLSRGHNVTAVARNASVLTAQPNLKIVEADIFETENLTQILKGHNVVISAYNAGWTNPYIYADFLKGSASINAAIKQVGIKRLLVVGGAGSLEISPGLQLVDTDEFPEEYKQGSLAARDALNRLREETKLDWTFVSPAQHLVPGKRTGNFRYGTDQPVFNSEGQNIISIQDLAVAIVDEIEKPKFIKKRFTVGY
ncbi:NAD(P)-dependent oxidoreductase [Solitalea lacus]|uniref:NAD(P)-dependent oxidoreductase n=1 Tax=Solitalea lacus TaxID=2911172 RepID=UPI001EDC0327|nr:NAD(P)-dependent oxidoreductase [Solitalea lacus]UKJ07572.1 NAD(P)-dependent oxidoreductase [Solitalea lacus]